MVDIPHLSKGNSISSPSREMYAENGITPPHSQHSSGDSCGHDMGSSSDARMLGPENFNSQSSSSSASSDDLEMAQINLDPAQMSDIFRAAHQLTQNDRLVAAEERKKNMDLMSFIESTGHSMHEVNCFLSRAGGKNTVYEDNTRVLSLVRPLSPLRSHDIPENDKRKGIAVCSPGTSSAAGAELNQVFEKRDVLASTILPSMEERGASLAKLDPVGLKPLGRETAGISSHLGLMEIGTAGRGLVAENRQLKGTETAGRTLEAITVKSTHLQPKSTVGIGATDPRTVQKSWASVVLKEDKLPKISLSFHPPSLENGTITIKPPPEILKHGNSLWSTCLVGSFINSRLPFKMVEEAAFKLWGQYGLVKVMLHDKDFFLFKFTSMEECSNVLALGPWYMTNKLLKLQLWKEGVDFSKEDCSKAPIWVKFHHIPLSYWSAEGLSYLASGIGKPLFLDKLTEKLEPMNYARICIEVLATSPLPETIHVTVLDEVEFMEKSVEVKVEYQHRPQSCPSCRVFGHNHLKCPKANFQWIPKAQPKILEVSTVSVSPDQHD